MKRKALKILSICLVLAVLLSLIGCSKPAPAAQNAAPASAPAETQKTTVKVWTLWTETASDANQKAFYRVLEKAKTDLPDIIIEHDGTENEAYKTKIKTAIAANEAPDVFFSWGAGFVKPFVDAGKVLPLDDYLKDGTSGRINPGANTFFTFDNKTYGLTGYKWVAVLYCNKELFEKNNIKIPDTYEELVASVKAFRAKGITPITVGEKDRWPGMFWQNAFALRAVGAQTCQDALAGKASFDQPGFAESAAKLKELVGLKAFNDGCMGLSYDEGNALFLQGKIPMYYMGNWFAGNITGDDSLVKDNIVCKKFPMLADGKGTATEYLGGAIDGFCVNKDSKVTDAAVKVAKYFAEGMAKDLASTGDGLPTWNVPAGSGQINPITQQIMDLSKDANGFVLAWDTFLEGAASEKHKDLVAEIFGSKIAPDDFAKEMQKLNEK